jgi:coproporphyrinogen III oxidase
MESLVRETQEAICRGLEALDGARFGSEAWERPGGGGGLTRVLEGGRVLERAGVNVSSVHGTLSPSSAGALGGGRDLPGDDLSFCAVGLSLVLHPLNPHAPAVHANYRYLERAGGEAPGSWWFGGGSDLTPHVLYEEDARHFHGVLKAACDRHDRSFYPDFKRACDAYFLLPHRGEARGIGGIFFDGLEDRRPEDLLAFVGDCAGAFLDSYLPILERRCGCAYTEGERRWQLLRRGRYVEFNLLHDRGTRFGLETAGRVESVLMSLPPLTRWETWKEPPGDSPEGRLMEVLRRPRQWAE